MSRYYMTHDAHGWRIHAADTDAPVTGYLTWDEATRRVGEMNKAETTRLTSHPAPCCDCGNRARIAVQVAEHFRAYIAVLARNGDARAQRLIAEAVEMTGSADA